MEDNGAESIRLQRTIADWDFNHRREFDSCVQFPDFVLKTEAQQVKHQHRWCNGQVGGFGSGSVGTALARGVLEAFGFEVISKAVPHRSGSMRQGQG